MRAAATAATTTTTTATKTPMTLAEARPMEHSRGRSLHCFSVCLSEPGAVAAAATLAAARPPSSGARDGPTLGGDTPSGPPPQCQRQWMGPASLDGRGHAFWRGASAEAELEPEPRVSLSRFVWSGSSERAVGLKRRPPCCCGSAGPRRDHDDGDKNSKLGCGQ